MINADYIPVAKPIAKSLVQDTASDVRIAAPEILSAAILLASLWIADAIAHTAKPQEPAND
jgi:hypothetical protein